MTVLSACIQDCGLKGGFALEKLCPRGRRYRRHFLPTAQYRSAMRDALCVE